LAHAIPRDTFISLRNYPVLVWRDDKTYAAGKKGLLQKNGRNGLSA